MQNTSYASIELPIGDFLHLRPKTPQKKLNNHFAITINKCLSELLKYNTFLDQLLSMAYKLLFVVLQVKMFILLPKITIHNIYQIFPKLFL